MGFQHAVAMVISVCLFLELRALSFPIEDRNLPLYVLALCIQEQDGGSSQPYRIRLCPEGRRGLQSAPLYLLCANKLLATDTMDSSKHLRISFPASALRSGSSLQDL